MSENEITPLPDEQGTSTSDSAQPDGGANTSTPKPWDHRYTEEEVREAGMPEWAVGKTSKEFVNLAGDMWQMINQTHYAPPQAQQQQPEPVNTSGQQYYQPYQQQQAPQAPADEPRLPTSEDWMKDADEATRMLARYNEYQMNKRFADQQQQLKQDRKSFSKSQLKQEFPDDYKRWGPEIDTKIEQYGLTTVEEMREVIKLVRGSHMDELLNERASATGPASLPRGANGQYVGAGQDAGDVLDFNKLNLPPNYQYLLQRTGLKERDLQIELAKIWPEVPREERVKRWVEMAKSDDVIIERGF